MPQCFFEKVQVTDTKQKGGSELQLIKHKVCNDRNISFDFDNNFAYKQCTVTLV